MREHGYEQVDFEEMKEAWGRKLAKISPEIGKGRSLLKDKGSQVSEQRLHVESTSVIFLDINQRQGFFHCLCVQYGRQKPDVHLFL